MDKATLIKDVRHRFTYHAPDPGNTDQKHRYVRLTDAFLELAELVAESTPYSREQSTAITLLQQARMMANAAIAVNEAERSDG